MKMNISTLPLKNSGLEKPKRRFEDLGPPLIMGILNVTPDSFYDGGMFTTAEDAISRAREMVEHGADIIDVGGESTRPFARPVTREEELARVFPVVEELASSLEVPISIDTRHEKIARACVEAGACIVNDVNGLKGSGMARLVAELGPSAVVMHMKGTPQDMQVDPYYDNVVQEVGDYLSQRVLDLCDHGIEKERLIIDPGIGFGKRTEDNLAILRDLSQMKRLGLPIMIGASRKSFIGQVLDLDVHNRLEGSIAAAVIAVMNGASIVRVHDVLETRRALKIVKAVMKI
ncbi:MAG: dihydropteroate synthase [Candidatus Thermoplasmatota archaeon]|nr:dihydropteroate synthase [Candidatus Thermoplasmatota archaeon]